MTDRPTWVGLRLGVRMLLPRGRAERGAVVCLVAGSALVMIAITIGVGLLQSLAARADVVESRAPIFVPTHGSRLPLVRVRVLDTGDGEATIDELGPRTAAIDPPPGVPAWPRAGEVWLSPAAAIQRIRNPYVASLIRGKQVGLIGREGLRDPDDVVAVMGVPASDLSGEVGVGRIAGFGTSGQAGSEVEANQEFSRSALHRLWIIGLATIGYGAMALMAGVARVADSARRQRLAVLQLLGAPLGTTRAVGAAHALGWSAVGALIGLALAWPAADTLSGLGVFGVTWWPSRSFNPGVVGVSLGGLALAAAWGGLGSVARDGWRARRRLAERRLSVARAAPLLAGAVVLGGVILSQVRHRHADVATPPRLALLLCVSAVLCSWGVVLAAPLLTRSLARLVGRRSGIPVRVAAARTDHAVRETSRMGLALLLLVLVCGVVLGAAQSISWQSSVDATGDRVLELPATDDVGRALPAAALGAALHADGVRRAEVQRRSGTVEAFTTLAVRKSSDLSYDFAVEPADVSKVAAAVQRAWPAAPPLLTDRDVAGDRGTGLMGVTLLACFGLATLMVVVALGVNLVSLQQGRRGADSALLAIGMSAWQLGGVRGSEVVLAALPGSLLATMVALPLGGAVLHLDHANVPVPQAFLLIPVATTLLIGALAGVAMVLSPRSGEDRTPSTRG